MNTISPADYLKLDYGETTHLLDVRTPMEYEEGHVVPAGNLPLFSNAERHHIGTLYKQRGKQAAVLEGLKYTGPKLEPLVREAMSISDHRPISLYCWRGGMRSGSLGWLLQTAGIEVQVIEGGYKALRAQMRRQLENTDWKIVLLGGKTGSGKTHLLHRLQAVGQQVVDLEKLARHKGSAFGWIGEEAQPSNAHFFNRLYDALHPLDPDKILWVEAESAHIGKVRIPDEFWEKMAQAPRLNISIPEDIRLSQLVEDYGQCPPEDLELAFSRIQKRLGGLAHREAIAALQSGDLRQAAKIALYYYDKTYSFSRQKANNPSIASLMLEGRWQDLDLQRLIHPAEKYYYG